MDFIGAISRFGRLVANQLALNSSRLPKKTYAGTNLPMQLVYDNDSTMPGVKVYGNSVAILDGIDGEYSVADAIGIILITSIVDTDESVGLRILMPNPAHYAGRIITVVSYVPGDRTSALPLPNLPNVTVGWRSPDDATYKYGVFPKIKNGNPNSQEHPMEAGVQQLATGETIKAYSDGAGWYDLSDISVLSISPYFYNIVWTQEGTDLVGTGLWLMVAGGPLNAATVTVGDDTLEADITTSWADTYNIPGLFNVTLRANRSTIPAGTYFVYASAWDGRVPFNSESTSVTLT